MALDRVKFLIFWRKSWEGWIWEFSQNLRYPGIHPVYIILIFFSTKMTILKVGWIWPRGIFHKNPGIQPYKNCRIFPLKISISARKLRIVTAFGIQRLNFSLAKDSISRNFLKLEITDVSKNFKIPGIQPSHIMLIRCKGPFMQCAQYSDKSWQCDLYNTKASMFNLPWHLKFSKFTFL